MKVNLVYLTFSIHCLDGVSMPGSPCLYSWNVTGEEAVLNTKAMSQQLFARFQSVNAFPKATLTALKIRFNIAALRTRKGAIAA